MGRIILAFLFAEWQELREIKIILRNIQNQQLHLEKLMASVDERLDGVETSLNEASAELITLIETLRGEVVSEQGLATLSRIETVARALADIVPNPQ